MVDRVKARYVGLTQWIVGFLDETVALVDAGKLDPDESTGLLEVPMVPGVLADRTWSPTHRH